MVDRNIIAVTVSFMGDIIDVFISKNKNNGQDFNTKFM